MNYVDYDSVKVPFAHLDRGGIDNAIKHDWMVGTEKELYSRLITPGDIVYDIGAYIGTHSIQFALLGGIVFAFEPSLYNYARCFKHCKPFRQIKVYDVGFNDKSYSCMTRFKDCNNQDASTGDPVQPIKYEILEEFMQKKNLPPPDFIKMDVEGMETSILKTFDKIFKVFRPVMQIEIHYVPRDAVKTQDYPDNPHWRSYEAGGFDFNLLFREYGYAIAQLDGTWRKQLAAGEDLNEFLGYGSIVCSPVEKIIKQGYMYEHS